jgi:enoyl-CoA hydratase
MDTQTLTSYTVADGVATITLDDGKVNALSSAMLGELSARLEQARTDDAIVVLTGRERTFSAGFDLRCEPEGWPAMLEAGARAAEQMLSYPRPIVLACTGNAIAMGAFLLLSADYRIGTAGEFKIGLNEVAIGLTVPWFGLALARHRLTAPAFDMCTITGALLDPAAARDAGFLDGVVDGGQLLDAAGEAAARMAGLNAVAHAATKLRTRERVLAELRDGIERISDPDREI